MTWEFGISQENSEKLLSLTRKIVKPSWLQRIIKSRKQKAKKKV